MSPLSALELRTSPSPSPAPVPQATGTAQTALPSFDDLLRSIDHQNLHSEHPHTHSHHHVHSRISPRPSHTPENQHHHHTHSHSPYSLHHHHSNAHGHEMRRAPSTPPTPTSLSSPTPADFDPHSLASTPTPLSVRTRPRSSTAPSISSTHLQSPFKSICPLPSTYENIQDHHAHVDRITALKEGDGEWSPWSYDAVVPSNLPYHARPHPHPRASTGSVPLFQHAQHSHSPLHDLQSHPSQAQTQPSTRPSYIRHPSLGSHSPLSMNEPLTPRSVHAAHEIEMKDDWRTSTPAPSSVASVNSFQEKQVAQPQGVRIPMLRKLV